MEHNKKIKIKKLYNVRKFVFFLPFIFMLAINIYAMENPFTSNNKTDNIISSSAIDVIVSNSSIDIEKPEKNKVPILNIIFTGDFYTLNFYPINSEINNFKLPESIYVQTGLKQFINCNISWADLSSIDTSVLGRAKLNGNIIPPENYEFEGGLEPVIELPFFIYQEGMKPLEKAYIHNPNEYKILLPLGQRPVDYINTSNKYPFKTENGDFFYCNVIWEDCPVPDTTGKFFLKGKYNLPWGIETDTPYITQEFYIMKDDDIYLDYIYILNDKSLVLCEWVKYIEDYENINIYYSKDNGEWLDGSEYCDIFENCLYIYTFNLSDNSKYSFKLEYNGKIYGDINILIDNSDISASYIYGDIDGGDNTQQELPTYKSRKKHKSGIILNRTENQDETKTTTEAAPKNTLENNSENSSNDYLLEEITPNKTIISGDKLIEASEIQGDYITFEKNGATLDLPSNFISDNNVKKDDSVSVEINKTHENIKLAVNINDKPVESIDGAKLRIDEKTVEIKKEDNVIKDTSNDKNYSEFKINETGNYKIAEKQDKNAINYIFITTIIIIVSISLIGVVFIKCLNTKK